MANWVKPRLPKKEHVHRVWDAPSRRWVTVEERAQLLRLRANSQENKSGPYR